MVKILAMMMSMAGASVALFQCGPGYVRFWLDDLMEMVMAEGEETGSY